MQQKGRLAMHHLVFFKSIYVILAGEHYEQKLTRVTRAILP